MEVFYARKLFRTSTTLLLSKIRYADIDLMDLITLVIESAYQSLAIFRKTVVREEGKRVRDRTGYGRFNAVVIEVMYTYSNLFTKLSHALHSGDFEKGKQYCGVVTRIAEILLEYKLRCGSRRFWIREILLNRYLYSEYFHLLDEMHQSDKENYFIYMRMTPERFDDLLSRVQVAIQKQHTNFRDPISPGEQLAMTLKYLAHGDSQRMISFSFRVGKSTVCKIIKRTLIAIWDALSPEYLQTPSTHQWASIADDFFLRWNFPNCVGAIDGKHVVMQCPHNGGSAFFNYKGTHSLVLLAACDAQYKFTMVDIGASGRQSDGGIFTESEMGCQITSSSLNLPPMKELPGTGIKMPHVFVADEAFPLLHNMMRPFPGHLLPFERSVYNYRLSRARRIIENAFGILSSKWRIYKRPIIGAPTTVENIIKATVCLHNYLMVCDSTEENNSFWYCPPGYTDGNTEGDAPGRWREFVRIEDSIRDLEYLTRRRYSELAKSVREGFVTYFKTK